MKCISPGEVCSPELGAHARQPFQRHQIIPEATLRRRKTLRTRAESYPGKKENEKDKDKSWVAKFMEGSDEDEAQWEPTSFKEKVLDILGEEKERSKFWGRIATIALGATLVSERISGKGIVTALNMATGVPIWKIEPALGVVVVAILAVGLYPAIARGGEKCRSENTAVDSFQIVSGRLACVALAGTILAEATTGKGILALLNIDTGVEITEIEGVLTFLLLLLFTADAVPPPSDDTKSDDTKKT